MIKTTLFLLPAWAAFCYGVTIPQSIVPDVKISAPEQTITFVIPCYPGELSCLPRTVTLDARDPVPQSLGSVTRSATVPRFLSTTTASPTTATTRSHHHPPRQSLAGSPSRSDWVWPYSTVTVITTVTATETTSSSTSLTSSTTSDSITRSVSTDDGSTSTHSSRSVDTSGVLTVRQVLGSPTCTVLEWPLPTETVVTKTITETVTVVPSTSVISVARTPEPTTSDGSFPSDTTATLPILTVPVDKKGGKSCVGNRREVLVGINILKLGLEAD